MSARPSTSSTHLPPPPSIPPALHHLANPAPILIDSQLPAYLLPSVLDLLRASSAHVVRRKRAEEEELRAEGLLPPLPGGEGQGKGKGKGEIDDQLVGDELAKRVERVGLMVGGYIAEKLTLARPPLASHLDIIKFICKDLFLYVYSKQIDNLRTNHRGIFVLQSHAFPPLVPLSSHRGASADIETAKTHLLFPQALIQGALSRLGMAAIVTAETAGLPQCTFQIRTLKAAAPSVAGTPNPNPSGNPNPNAVGLQGQGQGDQRHVPAPSSGLSTSTSTSTSTSDPTSNTGLGIAGASAPVS